MIPGYLEGIERHLLAGDKAGDHRNTEGERADCEGLLEVPLERATKQCDERAAGTVPEQSQADDHVREMMPLNDGQQTNEQQFVADRRARYEDDRYGQASHGETAAPTVRRSAARTLPVRSAASRFRHQPLFRYTAAIAW